MVQTIVPKLLCLGDVDAEFVWQVLTEQGANTMHTMYQFGNSPMEQASAVDCGRMRDGRWEHGAAYKQP